MLAIALTDRTFERATWRGQDAWLGKCLHCNAHLALALDGTPLGRATIEHIVPQSSGGSNELPNLGLACSRCNHQKGRRHDHRGLRDAKTAEVVERLLERRRQRWREAPDE
jgi:5-methylcytosine-specific restriction endonuclease McrA